jgi:uncharacterized protein YbaP (TraB family)
MKNVVLCALILLVGFTGFTQNNSDNTLLWRVSGNGLSQPSYIFGTIHMICADDIELSDSLKAAIRTSNQVYLELDLDNIMEMLSVVNKMKMKGDTTLRDLLTAEEYTKVKNFFSSQKGMLPFAMLEKYKPMLAASTLMQASLQCEKAQAMEQLIMKEAKYHKKSIKGLETMAYQLSIFDSIPYTMQAKQLYSYVDNYDNKTDNKEFEELTTAYREQQLDKLEALTKKDEFGMERFTEILLYNRNEAWVKKLNSLFVKSSIVVAVGAGHLPGEKGILNLLKLAGYTVEPVENVMLKKNEKQI